MSRPVDPFTAPILNPAINHESQLWWLEQELCDFSMPGDLGLFAVTDHNPDVGWCNFVAQPAGMFEHERN